LMIATLRQMSYFSMAIIILAFPAVLLCSLTKRVNNFE
jgi:hypothetical protein